MVTSSPKIFLMESKAGICFSVCFAFDSFRWHVVAKREGNLCYGKLHLVIWMVTGDWLLHVTTELCERICFFWVID